MYIILTIIGCGQCPLIKVSFVFSFHLHLSSVYWPPTKWHRWNPAQAKWADWGRKLPLFNVSSTDKTFCFGIWNQIILALLTHIYGGYITGPFWVVNYELILSIEEIEILYAMYSNHWLSEANVVCCKMLANLCCEIYLLHDH